jgi:D-hydroxyproline dehydrogenase subunit alpha
MTQWARLPDDLAVQHGSELMIHVDGEAVAAFEGESLAAALLSAGRGVFHRSRRLGEPRSLFCGIGNCFECEVWIEGAGTARACVTPVRAGFRVSTVLPGKGERR